MRKKEPEINLHLGCSLQAMREMKDNHYDLAIVDPPYGIDFDGNTTIYPKSGFQKGFNDKQHHKKKGWDKQRPPVEYFKQLLRVSKNQIIWGGNYFADLLPPSKGWIYWDKKITNSNEKNFSDGELAYTSYRKRLIKYTYDWIGFGYLNNPDRQKKIHPTEKPFALYKWLLENYAKEGDKILDTHLGSGSIACACYDLGFDLDAWEIDKDYYRDTLVRYNNYSKQIKLF